jgi:hypothetical protein
MPVPHAKLFGFLVVASVLFPTATPAQEAPGSSGPKAAAVPSLFKQVVANPTGKNGYEELVLAAEAFKSSKLYQAAQDPETSLSLKRRILADRAVLRALALLRQGVNKPVFSPREKLSADTPLPELAQFRALARLLAVQEYVYLADGRVQDAIEAASLGMRFGRVVQTDTLIAGLVGVAIDTVVTAPLAKHLDQLSARDCATLYQVCTEWLAQPNPQIRVMEGERRFGRALLGELAESAKKQGGFLPAAKSLGLDAEDERAAMLRNRFPATPEGIDAFVADASRQYEQFFEQSLQEMRKPPWERRRLEFPEDGSLGSLAVALIAPAYSRIDEAYVREQARFRLLACHCAIRRFKWERDRLPSGLAELDLGDLAVDPCNGALLEYTPRGSRYSLTSAGTPAEPDNPKAVNGRLPVALTPDD